MNWLARILDIAIQIYILAIILRAFLSWGFVSPFSKPYRWLVRLTEPVLAPIRRMIHRSSVGTVAIDFSPVVAILLLVLLRRLILRLL